MPKKNINYNEKNLNNAINAVLYEGLSKKSAASKFSVSRSTLQYRIKNPECKVTCGPKTVLSKEEENVLEKWIIQCSRKGFPQRKEDLQLSVKEFLDKNERNSLFSNNYPGKLYFKYLVFIVINCCDRKHASKIT